LFDRSE
jgi:hypothetical protein